ncbi:MAG: class I SAM-dependent methyltransferase [Bacteroidetes bacterium]|nr:class I SAM-dependent methyltransferase [Bacteroidota bacterium]MCL5025718.1 class I SAM-dependent methyltransferase [Chloroflexota bacterium]
MSEPARTGDLEALVVCPRCRGPVRRGDDSLECPECEAVFPVVNGIPLMFPPAGSAEAKDVTRLYDTIARDYDHTLPPHIVEHYLERRAALIDRYAPAGRVLDVGCGTGQLAGRLEERGYEVVGLDASLGMLEVLAERTPARAVAGLADALPFPTESFDLVVCVATLHHIAAAPRVAAAISEMCRVARRPGTIVIWDHNPLNPYWPFLMRRVPQDSGKERLVPLGEILGRLGCLRLGKVEVRRMGFTPDFLPRAAMEVWRLLERVAERTPVVREMAAHNVVIARKV